MTPPIVPSIYREPVRWGDVDPVSITRFDAYARFIEIGEDELWRAAELPFHSLQETFGVWLPRKLMHVDYHSPSRLGEMLTVVTYLSRVGTTGCTLHIDIMNADATRLHAAAHLVIVAVRPATFEKCEIPQALRARLVALVTTVVAARAAAAT